MNGIYIISGINELSMGYMNKANIGFDIGCLALKYLYQIIIGVPDLSQALHRAHQYNTDIERGYKALVVHNETS